MKKTIQRLHFVTLITLLASACSTVSVRVPVMRPAEINLRGKSELVLSNFTGPHASSMAALLKESIVDSGRFKLLNRTNLDQVMGELSLSASDLADPSAHRKLGKLLTGSILLVGNVEQSSYREKTRSELKECKKTIRHPKTGKNKTKKYPCTHYYRNGEAIVAMNLDVIDVQTAENLKPKRVHCKRRKSTQRIDSEAPGIDGNSMLESCKNEVIETFMRAIAPWKEYVRVEFLIDGDLPTLEVGVQYAERGEWAEAIHKFKDAIDMVDERPGMAADSIAKAHWNLGLAYEYTYQFDKAMTEVKKAFDMTGDESFLNEVRNIKRLRADHEKLKEQTGKDPTPEA
jgi:tetratricopeptide (TPR) repeat protein